MPVLHRQMCWSVARFRLNPSRPSHDELSLDDEFKSGDRISADGNSSSNGYIYAFLPEECGRMWQAALGHKVGWSSLRLDKKIFTDKIRNDKLIRRAAEVGLTKVCLEGAYVEKKSACYREVRQEGEQMFWMKCSTYNKAWQEGWGLRLCHGELRNSCSSEKEYIYWEEIEDMRASCSPSDINTGRGCVLECSRIEHRTRSKLCDHGMYQTTNAQEDECETNANFNGLRGCYRVRYGKGMIEPQTR